MWEQYRNDTFFETYRSIDRREKGVFLDLKKNRGFLAAEVGKSVTCLSAKIMLEINPLLGNEFLMIWVYVCSLVQDLMVH